MIVYFIIKIIRSNNSSFQFHAKFSLFNFIVGTLINWTSLDLVIDQASLTPKFVKLNLLKIPVSSNFICAGAALITLMSLNV